jgi:hypothetical protein
MDSDWKKQREFEEKYIIPIAIFITAFAIILAIFPFIRFM